MTTVDILARILPIAEMFTAFYDVPAYQRDYVWGEEHVEQLLDDIKNAFDDNRPNYFLGTTVVSQAEGASGVAAFDLIDGQQRLTTIFLILCAMKHFLVLKHHQPYHAITTMLHGNASYTDDEVRIRLLPLYEESRGLMEFLASDRGAEIGREVMNRMFDSESQDIFANLLRAYKWISLWLHDNFATVESFAPYFTFFCRSVLFIRIQTINVKDALRLFETVNERGVRLDSVDLLKNMLFMHAQPEQFDKLRADWAALVKTIHSTGEKESIIRFVRYTVMSEYLTVSDPLVRENELYGWFGDNAARTGHEQNPQLFLNTLQTRARQFALLRKGKNINGTASDGVANIGHIAASIRQHIPLMLAGQHLDDREQHLLATAIEQAVFVNVFTSAPARVFEQRMTLLVDAIRRARTAADIAQVSATLKDLVIQPREREFVSRLRTFSPVRTKAAIMRYTLARLTRYMMNDEKTPLEQYIKGLDVCPILPLDGANAVPAGERQAYLEAVHSIGNYVLVEKPMAKSVMSGKASFADAVRQSNAPYVRRFTIPMSASDRMHAIPAARWDVGAVNERTTYLIQLAVEIWGTA